MSRSSRTIVAVGGWGLDVGPRESSRFDPRDAAFDRWLVARVAANARAEGRERPRIAWIGTAGGDSQPYADAYLARFTAAGADAVVLSLFRREVKDLAGFVLGCDAVFVGGGSTANLLAIWRLHGLDVALREAWEVGVLVGGVSAGMLCWFAGGTTDSFDLGTLAPLSDGLGLLPESACPHYDGEPQRRPLYERLVRDAELAPGVAVDDGAAAVFTGTQLSEVIAWRGPTATAYRVTATGSSAALPTTRL